MLSKTEQEAIIIAVQQGWNFCALYRQPAAYHCNQVEYCYFCVPLSQLFEREAGYRLQTVGSELVRYLAQTNQQN